MFRLVFAILAALAALLCVLVGITAHSMRVETLPAWASASAAVLIVIAWGFMVYSDRR